MSNDLEKKEYYCLLFDLYRGLFTDKQKEYFEDYYFNDLSLFEIAQNSGVSRNAVYDQIQKVIKNLDEYENILGLLAKENKLSEILDEYKDSKNIEVQELITKIKNME